ncbi:MAG: enoyl-CoA hydratase [Gammaproteobacteria bacterium]|nr:enoyl-CoA hydratase-related protein [Gammaproteobacteria bacterium]MXX94798.1 enoyl-CoA hydratase [Gammaproteobacteria bacterium]MYF53054.1 enoyl-CoA hydratase [Gammaproteobacteria bacterium]MYK42641.1 enoyl-CoA hydratase [Gammaproteobacteria bacterium]
MSSSSEILYEVREGVATITLNRPGKRNALSATLVAELQHALRASEDDASIRCVVVTGNGTAFCSGVDLDTPPQNTLDRNNPSSYPEVLRTMVYHSKPIIAMVNGAAFAGGLGLIGAADIVIVDATTVMSFSEVRIGVIPAVIAVVCIPKLGVHLAKKLFFTAERFNGKQAVEYGLAHDAVSRDQLRTKTMDYVEQMLKAGPNALMNCKELTREVPTWDFEEGLKRTSAWSQEMFKSAEAMEGSNAFNEKRRPIWDQK